jgi:hypothetical protein
VQTETRAKQFVNDIQLFFKNVQLASAQQGGDSAEVARLTAELNALTGTRAELNAELKREQEFKLANIEATLAQAEADRAQLAGSAAAFEEAQKRREAALARINELNARAGGFGDDDITRTVPDKNAIDDDDITKFNAANDALFAFNQGLEELSAFAATGKTTTEALSNATSDLVDEFIKAQGLKIIEPGDIDDFQGATRELGAYRDALARIEELARSGAGPATIAAAVKDADEAFRSATEAATRFGNKLDLAKDIVRDTRTESEKLQAQLADARVLLDEGFISPQTFERYKRDLQEAANQTTFLTDLAKAATEDIQGAFTDLFTGQLDSLSDFADAFGQTLQRVAANFLANQAIQFLLGKDFGSGTGTGQLGGALGGLAGLFTGGGSAAQADSTPGIAERAVSAESLSSVTQAITDGAPAITAGVEAGGTGLAGALGGLFSSIGGGIGGAAGGMGGLFGTAISAFAGFFADGGNIGAGQVGVVGERGPELVSGPAAVTPMGAGAMSAPELNVNVVNVSNQRDAIDAIGTAEGDTAILNAMRRNPGAFKRELGIA